MGQNRVPIIPVLDVLSGQVVRAVGGRRSEYRPIRSLLVAGSEPRTVARAMIQATAAETVYIADLNAIMSGSSRRTGFQPVQTKALADIFSLSRDMTACPTNERLEACPTAKPIRILLDRGIRTADDVILDDTTVVVGTETLDGPHVIDSLRERGVREITLSLDLFEGRLLGDWAAWGVTNAMAVLDLLAKAIEEYAIREVILLDIARVGGAGGTGTEALLRSAASRFPRVRFLAGGGVRGPDDYRRLAEAGAAGVLASTAIHEGKLSIRPGSA